MINTYTPPSSCGPIFSHIRINLGITKEYNVLKHREEMMIPTTALVGSFLVTLLYNSSLIKVIQ